MTKKRLTPEEKLEKLKQKEKEQVEKLKKQQSQLKAQIRAKEARTSKAEEKLNTRRKIILGALIQTHITKNPNDPTAKLAARLIDEYVIGDKERALFDLEPLPENEQERRRAAQKKESAKAGSLTEQF